MHIVAEGPHAMGACCRVTGTPFSGREALPGERTCQGSPHGRVGVKERRGEGVTHAEETVCKEPRRRDKCQDVSVGSGSARGAAESGTART